MSSPYPHVLIVGGGLGGLTLAQALRKQGISFEVFEREPDPNSRPQGWCIGLHTMMADLKASFPEDMPPIDPTNHLLPLELPTQIVFYDGTKDPWNQTRVGTQSSSPGDIIRAHRGRLRNWLLTNIDVQYGKSAVRLEEHDDKVTVFFKDGTSATGDIVVGADGVHSVGMSVQTPFMPSLLQLLHQETSNDDIPVRYHMTNGQVMPKIVPLVVIAGEIAVSGRDFAEQLELGHSSYVARTVSGEKLDCFYGLDSVSPDGKTGNYYWFMYWKDPAVADDPEQHWISTASPEEQLKIAQERVKKFFAPVFQKLVLKSSVDSVARHRFLLREVEVEARDLPAGRVTLLGDAAHCMLPCRYQDPMPLYSLADVYLSQCEGRAVFVPCKIPWTLRVRYRESRRPSRLAKTWKAL
jgi:hypothetical protein